MSAASAFAAPPEVANVIYAAQPYGQGSYRFLAITAYSAQLWTDASGVDKVAETDGAYFGGYPKPANWKENRIDRRLARNQNGKRQSLVIIRERNGNTLPMVFKSESAALGWIKSRLLPGTVLNADEAASWDALSSKYEMRRINHEEAYSDGEACTNMAESFFSRIRRAEIGHHHHVSGPYLLRYAQESAWREDALRVDNGSQVRRVAELALHSGPSVDFSGIGNVILKWRSAW